jgi:hypothetical protein
MNSTMIKVHHAFRACPRGRAQVADGSGRICRRLASLICMTQANSNTAIATIKAAPGWIGKATRALRANAAEAP